eukprot:TRINITY_DN3871_c0_g1_i2.p1 TRINITY_DN3871_c0_g1~~TRINITY_DN3871_c0_g1_i2.p1  ORF type:complete len:791 (+),score=202.17 TRINITY_DN3871_c0_g1_i2:385-2757(+)
MSMMTEEPPRSPPTTPGKSPRLSMTHTSKDLFAGTDLQVRNHLKITDQELHFQKKFHQSLLQGEKDLKSEEVQLGSISSGSNESNSMNISKTPNNEKDEDFNRQKSNSLLRDSSKASNSSTASASPMMISEPSGKEELNLNSSNGSHSASDTLMTSASNSNSVFPSLTPSASGNSVSHNTGSTSVNTTPKKPKKKSGKTEKNGEGKDTKKVKKERERIIVSSASSKAPSNFLRESTGGEATSVKERSHLIIQKLYKNRLPDEHVKNAGDFVGLLTENNDRLILLNSIIDSASLDDAGGLVTCIYNIFQYIGLLDGFLHECLNWEIHHAVQHTTLFRGNNLASRLMTLHTKRLATNYMEETLSDPVRKIVQLENISFEIDSGRLKAMDSADKNQAHLEKHTQNILNRIFASAPNFPSDLRQFYKELKRTVAAKYPGDDRLVIANFIFLRFFNPFIISPPNRLMPSISPKCQRNLMLVSKLVQTLANGVRSQSAVKEEFMAKVNKFILHNIPNIEKFIDSVTEEETVVEGKAKSKKEKSNRDSNRIVKRTEISEAIQPTDVELESSVNILYTYIHKHHEKILNFIGKQLQTNPRRESIEKTLKEMLSRIVSMGVPPLLIPSEHLTLISLAASKDLSAIAALKVMFVGGRDVNGAPVLVFVPSRLQGKKVDMESMLLYFVSFMHTEIKNQDYLVLWIHAPIDSHHRPSLAWLKQAYGLFDSKMRKNVKHMLIIKPTIWFRILIGTFRPFLSSKFWAKLKYLDSFEALQPYFTDNKIPEEIMIANQAPVENEEE